MDGPLADAWHDSLHAVHELFRRDRLRKVQLESRGDGLVAFVAAG